jgi:hypothetical protein
MILHQNPLALTLPLAALLLFAACTCPAQVQEALLTTPDLIPHTDMEPSIGGSGLIDPAAATVRTTSSLPSAAPAIVLHNPVHLRGPLWHTADVEGGQTSIRPAMPYEKCHCFSSDGGNGAFAFYLTDHLGVAADGSRISAGSPGLPVNLTSYLFGPQASALIGRHVLPFGHLLLGKTDVDGQNDQGRPFSTSSVAMGWGGGVDVVVNRDASLRLAQVDTFINLLPHSIVRQNNVRLTFGVVFRFGR